MVIILANGKFLGNVGTLDSPVDDSSELEDCGIHDYLN